MPRLATSILHLSSNATVLDPWHRLGEVLFFPSRPLLSYLMEMNSGSRKPFSAGKFFALSKGSECHVHSMPESLGTSRSITQSCSNNP